MWVQRFRCKVFSVPQSFVRGVMAVPEGVAPVPEVDQGKIVDANKKFAALVEKKLKEVLSACFPMSAGKFNYELLLAQFADVHAYAEHAVLFRADKLLGPPGVDAVSGLSNSVSIGKEPKACSMVRDPIKESAKGVDNGCWWYLKGDDCFSAVVTESVGDKRNVPFLMPSKYASPGTIACTPVYVSQTYFGTLRGRTTGRSAALTQDGSALKAKKYEEVVAKYRQDKLVGPKRVMKRVKVMKTVKRAMK